MKTIFSFFCLFLISNLLLAQDTVDFKGTIDKDSVDKIIQRIVHSLDQQTEDLDKAVIIRLDSSGGNIEQARRLVREIKRLNLEPHTSIHTMISTRRKNCESACTIIFTAGKERYAHIKARFGFHSPRYQRGAPRGTNIRELEQRYRDIWLSYIADVDEYFAQTIDDKRWLYRDRMSYAESQDAYPGFVTELIR